MRGNVLNIQRFCTDDGPGIRTTVFLKGCPLRCLWCHNPESQRGRSEILFAEEKCVGCGRCVQACPAHCHTVDEAHSIDRAACRGCGECTRACPTKALELFGEEMTAQQVLDVVVRDEVFYRTSGGGVTVSGGEPLYQPAFTQEILRLCCERKIHTAIETSGYASEQTLLSVLQYCDLVLFDLKETDETRHMQYTGVPLQPILQNLERINEQRIPIILRLPIIPTLNDREEHFRTVAALRYSLEYCQGIQIMPYHSIGSHKYGRLGRAYDCDAIPTPTAEQIAHWNEMI